jgi:hypothetical protein
VRDCVGSTSFIQKGGTLFKTRKFFLTAKWTQIVSNDEFVFYNELWEGVFGDLRLKASLFVRAV